MRRGPKPAKSKEAKPPVARKSSKNDGSRVGDLEKRLAEALKGKAEALGQLQTRDRELVEAREQQTATSDILRVISSSPTDAQPVFDAILRSAVTLCNSLLGNVVRVDGDLVRLVATLHPRPEQVAAIYPAPLTASLPPCRAIRENTVIHVPDVEAAGAIPPAGLQVTRAAGIRSLLVVPMRRDEQPIGAILIARPAVGPFPDEQIALLQTFADQAVIAIENVRLFKELQSSNRDLTTALDQQTATSEILGVISQSPTDLQPVMNAVAENAARLCEAIDAQIFRIEGGLQVRVASYGSIPNVLSHATPPNRGLVTGRAILERRTIHVHDLAAEVDREYPDAKSVQQITGQRTTLATPLLREGEAIGVILIRRREVRPFTDKQIALLETFADQAVIAIENVRLFKELEARNKDLTESLEQQTATSEILRVISQSPTDVQPVFDAVVESGVRLCHGNFGAVYRYDGELVHLVANHNITGAALEYLRQRLPRAPGRVILERRAIQIGDFENDPDVSEEIRIGARLRGSRSNVSVPMVRGDDCLGFIVVGKREPGHFPEKQVALLQTFADQAVIAIENVRLFKELEVRNSELTDTLEQQTATAEILGVISRSPTDLQPVLDAVAQNAARVCGASDALIRLVEGDVLRVVAHYGPLAGLDERIPLNRGSATGRAISDRQTIHLHDLAAETAAEFPVGKSLQDRFGHRTVLAMPLLREGIALGGILIRRQEVRPFSDKQIQLLQTFADQAVIAIENVRLFTELQASNRELTTALDQQTATSEVLQTIAQAQTDVQPVFDTIVRSATLLCGGVHGVVLQYDGDLMHLVVQHGFPPESLEQLRQLFPCPPSQDLIGGRAIIERRIVHIPDLASDPAAPSNSVTIARIGGYRSLLAVPMMRGRDPIGCIVVSRGQAAFSDPQIELVKTFAAQAVIAIENVRLFKELQVANRELAAASQHKSEFLANMSHELRTPLNAIIGFSEVLSERMFGELNEKQEEYSKDIHASGQHLLSLINDILDLSKIEAGRMELELTDFHLPTALDSALTLVRERAGRRSIALHLSADERLGQMRADERKVRQVVLNLLSNAIKFTPEGGSILVAALAKDGSVEVSVSDTGVGIAPEDQEAVFEEFRQVGTAEKKVEGTGLGLTLCRKFVELHGGKIWVTSQVGVGSTFTFSFPLRNS